MVKIIHVECNRQGLFDVTSKINAVVNASDIEEGLCTICIQHTSASLTVQENADPSARHDLERWLNRLVPENDSLYTHTYEGPDDMPGHIKSMLTATTLSIPVLNNQLCLGTWQGIYVWEHRHRGGNRSLAIHVGA
jgi:secondary thiamine-phosphate synthase enzyme